MSDDRALSQQQRLLARIAHRYYVANQTQEEIGREFGFSRPKVQRLLDRARQTGIVDIRIAQTTGLNLVLEDELRSTFGLVDAIVAPSHADPDEQREAVVRAAADFLDLRLPPGAVVAVGKGKMTEDGKLLPMDVKPGDRILYGKYSGNEIKIDDVEHLIMHQDDILGILK